MLVIHEIFGLTDEIKAVTERMAQAGYVALAVDLFANQNRAVCMARMSAGVFADSLDHQGARDTRAALNALSVLPGVDAERLGAIGFCLGGSLAIALACTDTRVRRWLRRRLQPAPAGSRAPRLPGGGQLPGERSDRGAGPGAGHRTHGGRHRQRHQGVSGTRHSFATPGPSFDGVASIDAWNRVITFFETHVVEHRH